MICIRKACNLNIKWCIALAITLSFNIPQKYYHIWFSDLLISLFYNTGRDAMHNQFNLTSQFYFSLTKKTLKHLESIIFKDLSQH